MGRDWNMCQRLNNRFAFWMNQVLMMWSVLVAGAIRSMVNPMSM